VSVCSLIIGQASCGVPSPLEISTETPLPSLLHARNRVPSADVIDRYPNACPARRCLIPSMLIGRQLAQTELGNLLDMLVTPFPMSL
jgi:hypothetical protein